MRLDTPKGMKDFSQEEKIQRDEMISKLIKTFQKYGFSPIETPVVERYDVLSSKYTGGSEILKETFKFKDQGKRQLGLRYDLTVPFARFVGMNPNIKLPFKRYQIGRVYRDGPIKAGRFREFYQCDVDVVGTRDMAAEAELLNVALDVFKELDIPVEIKVNNRKILNSFMELAEVDPKNWENAILTLDKLEKIGEKEVAKELNKKLKKKQTEKLIELIRTKGSNSEKIKKLEKELGENEGLQEIKELFKMIKSKFVKFDPTLARGLSYYTSTVFEAFTGGFSSSLAGGGRYDEMIGQMLGSKQEYPSVGISFGLEPITEVINRSRKTGKKTVTQLFIIPIKTKEKSFEIAQELRKKGINVDIDLMGRGISNNLSFANSYDIPYVLFIGEKELEKGKLKLKNMKTGKEEFLDVKGIVKKVQG